MAWRGHPAQRHRPLPTAVNGTDDFGYGSSEAISDDMALYVAVDGLAGEPEVSAPGWAQAIFNQVITPANSGDPVRMSAAASNAESLSMEISHLCYVPS